MAANVLEWFSRLARQSPRRVFSSSALFGGILCVKHWLSHKIKQLTETKAKSTVNPTHDGRAFGTETVKRRDEIGRDMVETRRD